MKGLPLSFQVLVTSQPSVVLLPVLFKRTCKKSLEKKMQEHLDFQITLVLNMIERGYIDVISMIMNFSPVPSLSPSIYICDPRYVCCRPSVPKNLSNMSPSSLEGSRGYSATLPGT